LAHNSARHESRSRYREPPPTPRPHRGTLMESSAVTDSVFYRRLFAVAAAIVFGYLLLEILVPLKDALGWGTVLAFLLHPLHKRLTVALRGRAALSAGILTLATPFVVLAPVSLLSVVFFEQSLGLVGYLRAHPFIGFPALIAQLEQLPWFGASIHWVDHYLPAGALNVHAWISTATSGILRSAAATSGNVAFVLFGTVISFFMMLFLLFFLLRDGQAYLRQFAAVVPLPADRRDSLLKYLGDVTRAVVYGSTVTAIVQGLFVAGGFAIAGLPSPMVFGVVAMITAMLPAGAAVVLIPAVLYLGFQAHWGAALFLALWSAGLVLLENIVRPMLTAHRAHVSTLAVFVGAVGGVTAFGILGLILGPVLLSFIVALVRFLTEQQALVATLNSTTDPRRGGSKLSRAE
jgi:predicted PurR-regulated permease PerM